jgi:alkyldihydroxyacetonephosphate synthase
LRAWYDPATVRRWNGWGDEAVHVPVPAALERLLAAAIGEPRAPVDVPFASVCAAVPPSRLPAHPLFASDAATRACHARGQGFPDLVALRSGHGLVFPDAVAQPRDEHEVAALLALCREREAAVIPYGGGTSVVGHVNPERGGRPVLTLSLARLAGLRALDERSRLASFGPGATGPAVEEALGARGYRLGHYPQSFERSTLGGWIATRSSGQQSRGYGRIEDLFAGGTLVAPAATLRLPPFPASAAGPDLRQLVLGSEGRAGVLTEATVRVSPCPEREGFEGVLFREWGAAAEAARGLAQSGVPISMLRASNPLETETTFALKRGARAAGALEAVMRWRGLRSHARCLVVIGFSGTRAGVRAARSEALTALARAGAVRIAPSRLGAAWAKGRFRAPYLRDALWEKGYGVDTVETAVCWDRVPRMVEAVESALRAAPGPQGERVHAFTHLSHVYATGASVYTTFVFRLADTPEATLLRWRTLKAAASEAIVREGGTISHQHGVGVDHAPYLAAEKGAAGLAALAGAFAALDPEGLLNPGKLLREGSVR